MRKENTFNQGLDENLIRRSLEFFATQKIGMTLLFCLLTSTTVHAQCVPPPDCASIGYTATSCEGGFVRCPFDISKLLCMPCDSSYTYSCSGTGYSGGSGSSCNGKYKSCTCASGYEWDGNTCIQICSVGNIMYSDGTCCVDVLDGKTPIGVVVKDNALVMSQRAVSSMAWGTYGISSGSIKYHSSDEAKTDYNGRSNTATIIARDSGAVAAKYCNDYTTTGTSAGDWYLPAAGELYSYVYGNYNAINTTMSSLGWSTNSYYWSSSAEHFNYAWTIYLNSGSMNNLSKSNDSPEVSCFLPINVSGGVATSCDSSYKYACSGTGYSGGSGTACGGLYESCTCVSNYTWNGSACVCDSSFQYFCTYDYESGGNGTACGRMYESCTCVDGYEWDSVSGSCQVGCSDNSCSVGNIMYSDGTCCADSLNWKTPIGIVVKDNELVLSQRSSSEMYWSNVKTDTSLDNLTKDQAQDDYNGRTNTATIITDDTSNIVAKYCNDYTTAGTSAGDWYLPAAGELYSYVYGNYSAIEAAMSSIGWSWGNNALWSSSESSNDRAWFVGAGDGYMYNHYKNNGYYVSCLLAIN